MSLPPSQSTVYDDIVSLFASPPDLGRNRDEGLLLLAALGGYLSNRLLLNPPSQSLLANLARQLASDPAAEQALLAILRGVEHAGHGAVARSELEAWATRTRGRRDIGPPKRRLKIYEGRRYIARRYRRLIAIAERGAQPPTACILRGMATSARILAAMGWLPSHLGFSLGHAFETLADGGPRAIPLPS